MSREHHLLIELEHTSQLNDFLKSRRDDPAWLPPLDRGIAKALTGIEVDWAFPLVPLYQRVPRPGPFSAFDVGPRFKLNFAPEHRTYLTRATVSDDGLARLKRLVSERGGVAAVYVDLPLQRPVRARGETPIGDLEQVKALLGVPTLRELGMDGHGVSVAVVDGGINGEALTRSLPDRASLVRFNLGESFPRPVDGAPQLGNPPFGHDDEHGTMCAFDVCIAAPRCTLLDVAINRVASADLTDRLSDLCAAYGALRDKMHSATRSGARWPLVISNSIEINDADDDGTYKEPLHAVYRLIDELTTEGADIVFAAGNLRVPEPDDALRPAATPPRLRGLNSHPNVLSVAAVSVEKNRLGISVKGPGGLVDRKPDVAGYARFRGFDPESGPDDGTSVACAVVAGVIAAIRSRFPFDPTKPETSPAALRDMIMKRSLDRGPQGYDYAYGAGIVDGAAVARALSIQPLLNR